MSGSRLLALVPVLMLLGCNDPMSASDGISPAAGQAQRHNKRVHVVNPYAGDGPGANPGGSGTRAATIIQRYEADVGQAGTGDATGATAP